MQSQNEYIGDDNFKKFLAHYNCNTPLGVIKMRFAGAICSPNEDLRPADVISSLWEEGQNPRLETKKEAELFFKFFMGLWDKTFEDIGFNKFKLPFYEYDNVADVAAARYDEIEFGFLEGFFGGLENVKVPAYLGEVTDSLSELSKVYEILYQRAQKGESIEVLKKTLKDTDKMVQKAIDFIVENYALPKIKNIGDNAIRN